MKIYEYRPDDRYGAAYLLEGQSDFARRTLEGKPFDMSEFGRLRLRKLCNRPEDVTKELADFVDFESGGLLVAEKTKRLLEGLLLSCGTWIECDLDGMRFFYFYVTMIRDVLDESRTEFEYFNGQIVGIKKYAFKSVDYSAMPIFRVSYNPRISPFVTERFVAHVKENSLRGLVFKELASAATN